MFESIRSQRRWLMPLLSALVFLPFIFSGVYGFTRYVSEDNAVAKIDGESISPQELDDAQRQRIEQMRKQFGNNFDARIFETPQIRALTLDSLLNQKALEHAVTRLRLEPSDARVRALIAANPTFQVDGRFDYETYSRLLSTAGISQEAFESRVRFEAGQQALEEGLGGGALVPRTVAERLRALENERRQARRLVFPPEEYLARAQISDESVKADYEANRDAYRLPEHAKVQYLVLSVEELAARAPVSEAAVRQYYEANMARWTGAEQRRASHILVTYGKDGSAKDKPAARALAERLLRELRAKPSDFARVAREQSMDKFSRAQGGDLGWFGRGMMTKPFEDAAFALKPGQISDVVESDFGFHIIELTGLKAAQPRPFEDVRATIEHELRMQAAQRTFAETAEQFSNYVYEQADSLAGAAQKFGLPLQTVDGLTRLGLPREDKQAWVFTPAVLDALFAPDATERHHNTKAIEVGNNALVSAHVVDYVPSTVQPFEEARAAVRAKLARAEAARLARAAGEARLAQLRRQPDDAGFEPVHETSRADTQYLPRAGLVAVMGVPAHELPEYVGIDRPDGAYVIVHVLGATSVPGEGNTAAEEATWRRDVADADRHAYVQAMRERFDARITNRELAAAAKGRGP